MELRLIVILLVLLPIFSYGQVDSSFLDHAAISLAKQPAIEKVYLHLDKPAYTFGDTIWYKAYTVVGSHHQLSALSGVLYVELIAPNDTIVTRQILHLTAGIAWGYVPLAHALKQGIYRVRAYTNWMRNWPSAYFYDQKIMFGGIMPPVLAKQSVAAKPDVQFFPEGGDMVNGIRCRMAVKAIAANGMGKDVEGVIEDNSGNVITDFTTQHLGMGEFAFTPQNGKSYKARISGTGETAFTIDLPAAKEEGYTITLNNSAKDSIYIKVSVNDKTFSRQKNSTFYILAQSNGKVYYTTQGKLEEMAYSIKVDKSRFPSGIAQFTLFAQNGEPLAERIAYIESSDTLQCAIAPIPLNITARQSVKIDLQVKDHNNKPVNGTFSAAIINESLAGIDEASESTIMNNLLLTSDLKGTIEQPNYYFTNTNDKTRADLDILMLTQGYRRFEWKQVLSDTVPTLTYLPEQALAITGSIKTPAGKPVPNGKVTLVDNKENLFKDTTADANGNFAFTPLYLSDTSIVVLRARKENNGSNVNFEVTKPGYPAINKREDYNAVSGSLPTQAIMLQQKKYAAFQQLKLQDSLKYGRQLKQVNIKAYRHKEPNLSRSANLNPGSADQVIMGDQIGACTNLIDCLTGKIPFLNLHKITVIINGNIIGNGNNYLNQVDPNDVYSIEVLRHVHSLSIYGSSIPRGAALVITLKDGSERSKKDYANIATPGLINFMFNGYATSRVFYVPKYADHETNSTNVSQQATIFWKPTILTDKDGQASFEYNNSDTKGIYRIVIEGIDDNGNVGRQVYKYEVK